MKMDALRMQLDNLNREIADLIQMEPVSLSHQTGDAEQDELFLYGIVGGKDVGKSSVINRLAGAKVSLDTDLLDEGTNAAVAYCHQQDLAALKKRLAVDAGSRVVFVDHDRQELKNVVLMDFPDFDSRFLSHRDDTVRLARHLQGVIWVTTPRKYGDYQFLNQLETVAQSHENYLIVLNKIDQLEKKAPLDTVRREVVNFLTAECVKRNIPPPDPQQFLILSTLKPDQYEFNHMRRRLIRPHSVQEITRAKLVNLKAEFDKNFQRIQSHYRLLDRLKAIDQALESIREGVADQFSDDYFNTVSRRILTLETLQRRISRTIFTQRINTWPILRLLFYPLAGIVSGFGGRIAFNPVEKKWPDSPRDLLRYQGLPASLKMQAIRDNVAASFPDLKPDLGPAPDFSRLIDDQFVQLLGEYEDQVTDHLAATFARPGKLKQALVYFPLIWFPFLQPLLLKFAEMQWESKLSFSNLKDFGAVFFALLGAQSLLISLVFLILFYTVWLTLIYAHSARTVYKKGQDEFQNLWYERFLTRLAEALARPLLDIRSLLTHKNTQLEQIKHAVAQRLQRIAANPNIS
ncbi:MAG: GTPase domain-containing protein [Proteobacteria bacterium]|nr:GTPase domain-containing protein [Pseudomonadota bacterium]